MKKTKKKLSILLISGLCCLTLFSGCTSDKKSTTNTKLQEQTQPNQNNEQGTYKPSELTIPSQEHYECPYMGLNFTLTKNLLALMNKKEIAMINIEEANEDETALHYALITWKSMTKEQRNTEVERGANAFYDWVDSLSCVGTIGAYQSEAAQNLDTLTGCNEHKELGKSQDGQYTYYLSINSNADQTLQEEVNRISYELTDLVPLQEYLAQKSTEDIDSKKENLGEFSLQDIEGKTYTQELFTDYDLTMVNVFTTWCSPCINEIPDLQKLSESMKNQKVQVVGIVLDSLNSSGKTNKEAIEKAKLIAKRTGASYPFLVPDKSYLNGRLAGIEAVPETFFVDKNGNIVGETYSGSRSLNEWTKIVQQTQKGLTP